MSSSYFKLTKSCLINRTFFAYNYIYIYIYIIEFTLSFCLISMYTHLDVNKRSESVK